MKKSEVRKLKAIIDYWDWVVKDEKSRAKQYRERGDIKRSQFADGAATAFELCVLRLRDFLRENTKEGR